MLRREVYANPFVAMDVDTTTQQSHVKASGEEHRLGHAVTLVHGVPPKEKDVENLQERHQPQG
eukprot:CAMPEP_0198130814 /NCGR_PEP_ID=MMETSP1442-20131203/54781_1 /TAXON_ID= /ORGANISM="Craspedostauros australis, Strain CCMP3328" /LENGTH=62 /DNA_ID=CAMNT_0043791511 /DNA_START=197 /DNA_END=382 /DNA_ORIENTATION=-